MKISVPSAHGRWNFISMPKSTVVFVYKFEAFMLPVLLNFIDLEFKKILSCIAQAVQKSVTVCYFHY